MNQNTKHECPHGYHDGELVHYQLATKVYKCESCGLVIPKTNLSKSLAESTIDLIQRAQGIDNV